MRAFFYTLDTAWRLSVFARDKELL